MWQGSINCSCHVELFPRRGLVGGGLEMDIFIFFFGKEMDFLAEVDFGERLQGE